MERYYFYLDNAKIQRGPLSFSHLLECEISQQTLIWYEGLNEWVCAGSLDEFKSYFSQKEKEEQHAQATPPPFEPKPKETYINITKPRAMVVESILITLFCCLPGGIVSLIYALRIDDLWHAQRYDEAFLAAKKSRIWVIISLVCMALGPILYFIAIAIGWGGFMLAM